MIHGEKVAEIALVGTRFKFCRLGMCHALMDTLEKKLKELGVKRMALPALGFKDTIMCQKQLLDAPSKESTMSNENFLLTFADHPIQSPPDTALEGLNIVSEEFQPKAPKGIEYVDQCTM
ncbi:hypothetical protein SAY86_013657 [Trapa natans]|uniref:Increased DNA methylation 1 C-terminal domain-containing protein n=1 Tax=Trapa natans TaxID=22666 RepID=A0AAN7KRD7_TRANT|nr:hypothetical protein SAY86_013657 [Trapa natans]